MSAVAQVQPASAAVPSGREIRIEGKIAYVPLTRGRTAVIDAEDVPLVEGFFWQGKLSRHNVYAIRFEQHGQKRKLVCMHRAIAGAPDGTLVDHINGNGLDNRRANLRLATNAENTRNQRRNRRNTSGYKGVTWHKATGKWRAQIQVNGRRKHLGCFDRSVEAYSAYCEAALRFHGEHARTA